MSLLACSKAHPSATLSGWSLIYGLSSLIWEDWSVTTALMRTNIQRANYVFETLWPIDTGLQRPKLAITQYFQVFFSACIHLLRIRAMVGPDPDWWGRKPWLKSKAFYIQQTVVWTELENIPKCLGLEVSFFRLLHWMITNITSITGIEMFFLIWSLHVQSMVYAPFIFGPSTVFLSISCAMKKIPKRRDCHQQPYGIRRPQDVHSNRAATSTVWARIVKPWKIWSNNCVFAWPSHPKDGRSVFQKLVLWIMSHAMIFWDVYWYYANYIM